MHKSLRSYIEAAYEIKLPIDEFMCYRHSTLWRPYPGAISKRWMAGMPPNEAIKSVYEHVAASAQATSLASRAAKPRGAAFESVRSA